jgi:hypothetical protein
VAFVPQRGLDAYDGCVDCKDGGIMDADLESLSREQLIAEVKKLRQGIREHRDSTGHELCWHHPALWSLLPEKSDPLPVVPDWPQFLQGCLRYRQSLDEQLPKAPRTDRPYRT